MVEDHWGLGKLFLKEYRVRLVTWQLKPMNNYVEVAFHCVQYSPISVLRISVQLVALLLQMKPNLAAPHPLTAAIQNGRSGHSPMAKHRYNVRQSPEVAHDQNTGKSYHQQKASLEDSFPFLPICCFGQLQCMDRPPGSSHGLLARLRQPPAWSRAPQTSCNTCKFHGRCMSVH